MSQKSDIPANSHSSVIRIMTDDGLSTITYSVRPLDSSTFSNLAERLAKQDLSHKQIGKILDSLSKKIHKLQQAAAIKSAIRRAREY